MSNNDIKISTSVIDTLKTYKTIYDLYFDTAFNTPSVSNDNNNMKIENDGIIMNSDLSLLHLIDHGSVLYLILLQT